MLLGLDIGSTALRACSLSTDQGGRRLDIFDSEDLPVGAVTNGEIQDAAAVTDALRELFLRADASTPQVIAALPQHACFFREASLPMRRGVPDVRAARELVDTYTPTQFGAYHLGLAPVEGGEPDRMMLVAAPRRRIDQLAALVASAGGELVGVDAAPIVLHNVANHQGLLRGRTALVDIGLRESRVMLLEGVHIRASSVFGRGGHDLSDMLQSTLQLTPEEAELYKQGGEQAGVVPRDVHEQLDIACQALAQGITNTIRSAAKAAELGNIQHILLFGRSSELSLLQQALSAQSNADLVCPAPLSAVQADPYDFTPSYLDAVRAASGIAAGTVLPWIG